MIKRIYFFFFQILLTIIIFDLVFVLFLPSKIKNISIFYLANEKKHLTKGFPKNYFVNNVERGFDINKSADIFKTKIPNEIEYAYNIFGNSNGCFDKERKENNKKKIYLAGDSFTWGFVPYDKRFSSILDNKLNSFEVYNCGVPHTGQLHQFSKFLDIYEKLNNLDVTIINIYENDIENDYFFPHSKVVNGYLVDDKYWCLSDNKTKIITKSHNELQNRFRQPSIFDKISSKLAKYSATSNIFYFFYKKIENSYFKDIFHQKNCPKLSSNIYNYSEHINDNNIFIDEYIKNIQNWINHSKINNYNIIFSVIPSKNPQRKEIDDIFEYLKKQDIRIYKFEDYIINNKISKKELYWKNDLHFNFNGHKEYAKYLKQIIKG